MLMLFVICSMLGRPTDIEGYAKFYWEENLTFAFEDIDVNSVFVNVEPDLDFPKIWHIRYSDRVNIDGYNYSLEIKYSLDFIEDSLYAIDLEWERGATDPEVYQIIIHNMRERYGRPNDDKMLSDEKRFWKWDFKSTKIKMLLGDGKLVTNCSSCRSAAKVAAYIGSVKIGEEIRAAKEDSLRRAKIRERSKSIF
jgi:hypothetical protein